MEQKLLGKTALITGASRGIGKAVALAYAQHGAHVVLLARGQKNLESVDDQIRANGGQSTLIPFDLKKIDELEALGPLLADRFGKLDIFVANAGVLSTLTPVAHSKIKDWTDSFAINVTANVQLIRTLDPLLRTAPAGRAIFVTSGLSIDIEPFFGSYAASKAALNAVAKTWAAETKNTNLKVNLVRPGAVDTDMLRQIFPGGYHGKDLRTPFDLIPLFVHLASPACQDTGKIFAPEDIV
jgi:NAD(P)-dependent dehydrogenase (short-subunit alcohol dehydrogenase family)